MALARPLAIDQIGGTLSSVLISRLATAPCADLGCAAAGVLPDAAGCVMGCRNADQMRVRRWVVTCPGGASETSSSESGSLWPKG